MIVDADNCGTAHKPWGERYSEWCFLIRPSWFTSPKGELHDEKREQFGRSNCFYLCNIECRSWVKILSSIHSSHSRISRYPFVSLFSWIWPFHQYFKGLNLLQSMQSSLQKLWSSERPAWYSLWNDECDCSGDLAMMDEVWAFTIERFPSLWLASTQLLL